jgi:membrane protein implicated in regulation of membrane protease activity
MIAGFSAAYAIGWAAAFFITSRVVLNDAFAWAALAFVLAALLTIVLTEIFLSRRRPYNVHYSRRMEESKQNRLSDRFAEIKSL